MSATYTAASLGIVVIGRNEGERLRRCLDSVQSIAKHVVYVDSGSTDGSTALAGSLGAEVVALDMSLPFTAARARNAGFARLHEMVADLQLVQFVDGDCEVMPTWLEAAAAFLGQNPQVACVAGRLRERFPERSIFNRLCDLEWDRPVGETDSCGGIFMMRCDVFIKAGGFRETLIAGEEPELCLRIRSEGGRIWRIKNDMAWHDAAMTRFSQWWRRAMRGGYAAAEGVALYGSHPGARYRRRLSRVVLWSMVLPAGIVALAGVNPWLLSLAFIYPLQVVRLAARAGASRSTSWLNALFTVMVNFPEMGGALKYWLARARNQHGRLIEYR